MAIRNQFISKRFFSIILLIGLVVLVSVGVSEGGETLGIILAILSICLTTVLVIWVYFKRRREMRERAFWEAEYRHQRNMRSLYLNELGKTANFQDKEKIMEKFNEADRKFFEAVAWLVKYPPQQIAAGPVNLPLGPLPPSVSKVLKK